MTRKNAKNVTGQHTLCHHLKGLWVLKTYEYPRYELNLKYILYPAKTLMISDNILSRYQIYPDLGPHFDV